MNCTKPAKTQHDNLLSLASEKSNSMQQ